MKKSIFSISFITLLLSLILGCEKDDICIEETTPLLIIRFYNNEIPDELKKVINLKVQIEGISGDYVNSTITTLTDSIAIPVKVTENQTTFKLILNGIDDDTENDNTDQFDLVYTTEDVFVSRSCGYKSLYNDVSPSLINDDDNWIKSFEITSTPLNIVNQKEAHVKIFH